MSGYTGNAFDTTGGGVRTLEYIATHINPILPIPEDFEPDMYLYPEPEEVASMDETFGYSSDYDEKIIFITYYDQEGKVWTTDSLDLVPELVRIDVAAHQLLLDNYDEDILIWNQEVIIQREVQWRMRMAKRIIQWNDTHES